MTKKVLPRLYCIPAANAQVVAVFRRGPTDWCHAGRWDLASAYEPQPSSTPAWARQR